MVCFSFSVASGTSLLSPAVPTRQNRPFVCCQCFQEKVSNRDTGKLTLQHLISDTTVVSTEVSKPDETSPLKRDGANEK